VLEIRLSSEEVALSEAGAGPAMGALGGPETPSMLRVWNYFEGRFLTGEDFTINRLVEIGQRLQKRCPWLLEERKDESDRPAFRLHWGRTPAASGVGVSM